jgi:methyl-accepting chemotaxis protein
MKAVMNKISGLTFGKNLRLRSKLLLITAIVFVGYTLSVLLGMVTLNQVKIGSKTYASIKTYNDSLFQLALLKSDLNEFHSDLISMTHVSKEKMSQIKDGLDGRKAAIDGKFDATVALLGDQKKKEELEAARKIWSEMSLAADADVIPAALAGNTARALEATQRLETDKYGKIIENISLVVFELVTEIADLETKTAESVGKKMMMIGITNAVVFVIILVTILLVGNGIVNPVKKVSHVLTKIADGDLRSADARELSFNTRDEIGELGRATNKMVADLKALIGRIRETASKTTTVSEKIVLGSTKVKQGAVSTSQAADETFASMEEMAASIKSVSENTESLSANVEQTSSSVTEMMASVENVARNMTDLASSVTETSSTVEEMTVSIEHVAKEAEDLTGMVHNTAASVEQMTKSIEEVDKHVREAGTVAQHSVEEARAGGEALSRSFKGMKSISETMNGIAGVIQTLGSSSLEINKILAVINEIADQTNLLALNAAIQAAQAGDAGRGFAVVASEVRELADRSRTAAKEIGEVIKRVQNETQDAVKSTEAGALESTAAMGMADRAAEALNKIVKGVEKTNEIMNMIMKSTGEQRAGSKEVLAFVSDMRKSSDQMKRAMAEQAGGGRQIRISVENMNRIMQEVDRAAREQASGSKQIVVAVENMIQMTQKVSSATAEQKQGGHHVVKATENISTIAKENLDAVEEMATSSENLVIESQALLKNVESFKL